MMRAIRRAVPWSMCGAALLAACVSPPDGRGNGDDAGGDLDTAGVPLAPDEVRARFASGGTLGCVDPAAREEARYDVRKAEHMPIDAAYLAGGGLVVADFTGDDVLDVFVPSEEDYQLWVADGYGGYEDRAAESFGNASMFMAVGGSAADVEGDGDLDLLVTRFDMPVMLFLNDGTGNFTDVSASSGLAAKSAKWQSSSWADFDLDGDLDLVVGSYGPKPPNAFVCDDTMPEGDPSALYTNDGNGTFTDRSDLLPPYVQVSHTFMTAWYDVNGDHYPELFIVNDFANCHPSVMLWNHGGTAFELVTNNGFSCGSFFGMGAGVGDLNEDGLPDFVLTSFQEVCLIGSSPTSQPHGANWVESIDGSGIVINPATQRYGWGAELYDADNDADLDALLTFGLWSAYDHNPTVQPDALFLNDGDGGMTFTDVSRTDAWDMYDPGITRGIATIDLNKDGWLDVIKRDLKGPTLIRTARCGAEAWVEFALEQPGTRNPNAVGATIRVSTHGPGGDRTQTRWIHSGSSSMYTGLAPEAHFGLDGAETIDLVEIVWPDGKVSRRRDLDSRQRYTVTREDQP